MLNQFHRLLTHLEATASKNDKVRQIEGALALEPRLGRLFELALSPYITFGIAKLPEPVNYNADLTTPSMEDVFSLLDDLAQRRLTGHAALAAVGKTRLALSAKVSSGATQAFDRILLKDLRCGVSEYSVNKAVPGTVPVFSCQLAPSEMPKLDELKFPIVVEPKLDGVRTIAIKRDGVVTLFSRNGLPFENFVELQNALTAMPDNTVLDGEVVGSQGFAALMTRTKAERGKHTDVLISYTVFDCLPLADWDKQSCAVPYMLRRDVAQQVVRNLRSPIVHAIESRHVANAGMVEKAYADYLDQGYEGVMLKDPKHLYSFKRNKTWRKLKPFDTADLTVTGVIEGKGKYAGMMGALQCKGTHAGKEIEAECGSGVSDAQRAEIWADFLAGKVVGRIAEIRFQEITKAQDSDTYSLRFTSFVRWRDDKIVEVAA